MAQSSPDPSSAPPSGAHPSDATPPKRQKRAETTRRRILEAVILCLDEFGYAETSITRIQDRAGLSRGSMSHHFPTRIDMIASAAEMLLDNATAGAEAAMRRNPAMADALSDIFTRIMDTPHGRAFVEVLVACRTDADLNARLSDKLIAWDRGISASYVRAGRGGEDAALLWSVNRAFLRGLLIHARFVRDPAELRRIIARYGRMLSRETDGM